MSKGGGTNTVKTDIPIWMQIAGANNYNDASLLAQQRSNPANAVYQGQRVADLPWQTTAVNQGVDAMQGLGAQQIGQARNLTNQAAGYNPAMVGTGQQAQQVQAGNFLGADVNAYMDPYRNAVLNSGLQTLDIAHQHALAQTGDQAQAAGAFGGSRHGIRESADDAAFQMQAGQLAANINSQAFGNAQQQINADQNRALSAGQANQSADLNAQQMRLAGQQANQSALYNQAGLQMAAGAQLGNLAQTQQGLTGKELALLDTTGQQQMNHQQDLLDSQYNNWLTAYNAPVDALNLRQSSLGLAPYSQSQTSTATGGGSAVGRAAGGALAGASIAGALGQSAGWGALAGAGVGAAASDPKLKKNIRKESTDPETGLGIFSWDYKGDPKSAPRRLGLMAEGPDSVKEMMPEAYVKAGKVGGILTDKLPAHLQQIAAPDTPKPKKFKPKRPMGMGMH